MLHSVVGEHGPVAVGFQSDGVDAGVGPAPAGHLLQSFQDAVHPRVVDRFGAGVLAGPLEPLGEAVDRDDPLGAHQPLTLLRHQAHAAAAPHRDGVARLDLAIIRRHVAGGEDV